MSIARLTREHADLAAGRHAPPRSARGRRPRPLDAPRAGASLAARGRPPRHRPPQPRPDRALVGRQARRPQSLARRIAAPGAGIEQPRKYLVGQDPSPDPPRVLDRARRKIRVNPKEIHPATTPRASFSLPPRSPPKRTKPNQRKIRVNPSNLGARAEIRRRRT